MGDAPLPARHIAIEGPIGVGKTSLVDRLAARFEGVKLLEDVQNPFLDPFYKGRGGAAFQVQIFFLLSRYQQHLDMMQPELFTRFVLPFEITSLLILAAVVGAVVLAKRRLD